MWEAKEMGRGEGKETMGWVNRGRRSERGEREEGEGREMGRRSARSREGESSEATEIGMEGGRGSNGISKQVQGTRNMVKSDRRKEEENGATS